MESLARCTGLRAGVRASWTIVRRALALLLLATLVPAQAATLQYVYDPVGRLTAVIDPDGDTTEYVYDDVGNILSVSRRSTVPVAIIGFAPTSGNVGTTVTISGTGFIASPAANTVTFNGTAATVSIATTTQLVVAVPVGATSGPIGVTNSRGTATTPFPFTVTVPQPPSITGFAPSIGAPGTLLTINGANFAATASANQVRINQASATVQSASASALGVTTPAASGGRIVVTTALGSATSANDYFIAPAPYAAGDIGATGRITVNGTAAPVTLAAAKVALLLVDATAGDSGLRVAVSDATFAFGATVAVYRPDGVLLATSAAFNATGALLLGALPSTGTYSVLLVPASGRSGSATVGLVRDVAGTLVNETPLDFTVAFPDQQGHFSFQAAAGDKPYIVVGGVTWTGGSFSVRRADGVSVLGATAFGIAGISVKLAALPLTGTYFVDVVPNAGTSSGKVTLTLRNIPEINAGTLTLDVPKVVTYTSDLQVARATFAGTASSIAAIKIENVTFTGNGSVRVLRPDGGVLSGPTSFGSAGVTLSLPPLPSTGTYVVEVTSGSSAGNATITLRNAVIVDVGTLTVDVPRTITFATDFQVARATFSGTAGETLGVSATGITFTGNGTLKVTRDNGQVILNTTTITPAGAGFRLQALPATGTYVVELSNGSAGDATLAVWRDVAGGSLTIDAPAPTTMQLRFPGQQGRFTFTTNGAQLGFALTGVTIAGGGTLSFLTSTGATVFNQPFGAAGLPAVRMIPLTAGTYTIVVIPASNGTGNVALQVWSDLNAGSVATGETKAVTIVNPGQQARFTFTATGEQLGFAVSGVTFAAGGTLSFLTASGATVFNQPFGGAGLPAVRMIPLTAGTYTVVVIPSSNATGSLNFRLWKDVNAGALAIDAPSPTTMTIAEPGQQGRFTFTTNGAQLGFNLSGVTMVGGGTLSFLTASGATVFNQPFGAAGLPAVRMIPLTAGTYTIVVIPASNGTGNVALQIWADVNAGAIAAGETRAMTVVNAGQQARLSFIAATGEQLGFAVSGVTFAAGGTLSFLTASGASVFNQPFGLAGLQAVRMPLLSPGSYTIALTPASNGTGSLDFTLWKDVTGTLALATPLDIAIAFPAQVARLAFAGTTGQSLAVAVSGATFAGGSLVVLTPSGSSIASTTIAGGSASLSIPTLGVTGSYLVVVTPSSNGTGTATVTLNTR